MSQGNVVCCLCVEICEDSKCLYDEDSGNPNEVHQLMMQYFDAKLLYRFTERRYKDMCLKCWQVISDFNTYQQSVYQAQATLHIKGEYIVTEIQSAIQSDIKREDNVLPDDKFLSEADCNEQSTECRINVKEESAASLCDTYLSADDSSKTGDTEDEHDDSVDVFTGGEIHSESSSPELTTKDSLFKEDVNKYFSQRKPRIVKADKLSLKASDDIIAQWKPVLDCTLCTEKYTTYTQLQYHFKAKHPQKKFQVECCEKMFFRRDRYEDHMRVHMDPNAFACSFCGVPQLCRVYLAIHLRTNHENKTNDDTESPSKVAKTTNASTNVNSDHSVENKWSGRKYIKNTDDFIADMMPVLDCGLCSEKYSRYSQFRKHFAEKHPASKCYITCCKRKITQRYRVLEHLRHHANPDVFKCSLCDARFTILQNLRCHIESLHNMTMTEYENQKEKNEKSGGKTLKVKESNRLLSKWSAIRQCVICKEKFSTFGRLMSHFTGSHPTEEFYVVCCKRSFKSRQDIETHVRYHLDASNYKCKECLISFSHSRSHMAHMRDVHQMGVSSKCDYCSTVFTNKRSLVPHMRTAHPDIEYPTTSSEN